MLGDRVDQLEEEEPNEPSLDGEQVEVNSSLVQFLGLRVFSGSSVATMPDFIRERRPGSSQ